MVSFLSMDKRWDVLGFGAVSVDDFIFVENYPVQDSKEPVLAEERHGGGLAGTALVAAARAGARAAYCGVFGEDDLSGFTLDNLQRRGVDCSPVRRHGPPDPFTSSSEVPPSSYILYRMAEFCEPEQEILRGTDQRLQVLFVDHMDVGVSRVQHSWHASWISCGW